jgi:hypothetical protein
MSSLPGDAGFPNPACVAVDFIALLSYNSGCVSRDLPIGRAIEEILLLAECRLEGEWEGQVRYLPLQ